MLDYKNPKLVIETSTTENGSVAWKSPSNIALIKYWGKHGIQLPNNPSISFTLNNAHTQTTLNYSPKKEKRLGVELDFYFEGKKNIAFEKKINSFLNSIVDIFPFLNQLNLKIDSSNSFPHSAGIASSASAMSALALCLCSLEQQLFGSLSNENDFRKKASFIARLGSGSACRSIYSTLAIWGQTKDIEESSDLFAVPYIESHKIFHNFHDDILIVSRDEKIVSSRAGHGLMKQNLYAENRYEQARQRLQHLLIALQAGDLETFGEITESEALTLHALMMTSSPPYILMHPNTLNIINALHEYRRETNLAVYFSLDAGPNIHLLYPDNIKDEVQKFTKEVLAPFCNNDILMDMVGQGPSKLNDVLE
ncbi:MAG: diphosphomevalonate decarboxylase [Saprospiraceae bacterium]|nr:diphosphomevalonate decarboxylase [Saprospiraceae bacterium]